MAVKRGRTAKGSRRGGRCWRRRPWLFAAHGYHDTSVPDIVREAGVGHGTFYEYFASRRAILVDLTHQAADFDSRLPRLRSQNLADRIRAEIFWYLSDHVEHLELAKVWHDAANFDPEIAETRRREARRRQAGVRKGIEAARIRPDIDPEIAATALWPCSRSSPTAGSSRPRAPVAAPRTWSPRPRPWPPSGSRRSASNPTRLSGNAQSRSCRSAITPGPRRRDPGGRRPRRCGRSAPRPAARRPSSRRRSGGRRLRRSPIERQALSAIQ